VLRRHRGDGLDTISIAARVYGKPQATRFKLTKPAHEAVRRGGLATLAREGLVIALGTGGYGHLKRWRRAPVPRVGH
jgi:hypothetical protein